MSGTPSKNNISTNSSESETRDLVLTPEKDSLLPETLHFHIDEPQVKEHRYVEYYIAGLGILILIGCWLYGYETREVDYVFNVIVISGALLILLAASNIVLEYAVKLAECLGVSELVIGLTIVSIGTSIPEIFTAVISAKQNLGAIVIGDIYGSYITQLTIFLGIVILISPKTVNSSFVPHVKRDGGLMLVALLILTLNISDGYLTRLEAGISMVIFFSYIIYLYMTAKRDVGNNAEQLHLIESMEIAEGVHTRSEIQAIAEKFDYSNNIKRKPLHIPPAKVCFYLVMIIGGCMVCYLGAHFMVISGANVARALNLPEHSVGATIIGFGTGFPEFVVSVAAARRKKYDIAYGNLLGSNVVDPLFSISIGVMVQPITLSAVDLGGIIGVLLPIAMITDVFIICIFCRRYNKHWQEITFGIVFLLIYTSFIVITFAMALA